MQATSKLEVYGDLSDLKVLFGDGMPLVSSLTFSTCTFDQALDLSNDDAKQMWLKLSEQSGNLSELQFYRTSQDNGVFKALARNAPNLRKVRLRFEDQSAWRDMSKYHTRVEDAVSAFLECPNLRHLRLTHDHPYGGYIESIANLCCRVRLKRKLPVYVRVLGYEYLV